MSGFDWPGLSYVSIINLITAPGGNKTPGTETFMDWDEEGVEPQVGKSD